MWNIFDKKGSTFTRNFLRHTVVIVVTVVIDTDPILFCEPTVKQKEKGKGKMSKTTLNTFFKMILFVAIFRAIN